MLRWTGQILVGFAVLELLAGWVQVQRDAGPQSLLVQLMMRAAGRVANYRADTVIRTTLAGIEPKRLRDALFSPAGAPVLTEIMPKYATAFADLVNAIRENDALPVLFYVPSDQASHAAALLFFQGLAARHDVALADASPAFLALDPESVYLLPRDVHPSRFGHQVMAKVLLPVLASRQAHRARGSLDQHCPGACLLGDLPPQLDQVLLNDPGMPFRMRTNHQGLRMDRRVPTSPRTQQIVMFLGDSFTQGTPLPVEDVYVTLLGMLLPDVITANAGVGGYTIVHERALYLERARHSGADIVVIQVSGNDLSDLLWFAIVPRNGVPMTRPPTEAETALVKVLHNGM